MRPSLAVLLLADVVALFHARALWSSLPARVVSHFGASGQPNGWMSREQYVWFYVGLVLFMTLAVLASAAAMGRPSARFNLPNRDHWLAPERRASTVAWLQGWVQWMGAATITLLMVVNRIVARANQDPLPALGSDFYVALGCFLAFVGAMAAAMLLKFSRPST